MKANDYVPQTTYEVYHNYPDKKVVGLYYVDDEGNKVTPYNLYFSSDMRKCNNDETKVHGRAFTCAMGKHSTTLYPVYLPNGKRYRNADLCGISARYKDNIIKDFITDRRTKLWHV